MLHLGGPKLNLWGLHAVQTNVSSSGNTQFSETKAASGLFVMASWSWKTNIDYLLVYLESWTSIPKIRAREEKIENGTYIIVAWMTHRHLNPRQFGKLSVNRMEASLATKHPISRATTTIKPKSRTSTKPKVSKNALLFTIVFRCMAEVT